MPKTLLLADDSVTIQKVVGITFANEDLELVTVDNGDDALEKAREVKPDAILADVNMPGLNGYELCRAIRAEPECAQIPLLLLTGTFETYDESRARDVGANGHIAKPFEAQVLIEEVQRLLAAPVAPLEPHVDELPTPKQPVAEPEPIDSTEFSFDDLDFDAPARVSPASEVEDLAAGPPLSPEETQFIGVDGLANQTGFDSKSETPVLASPAEELTQLDSNTSPLELSPEEALPDEDSDASDPLYSAPGFGDLIEESFNAKTQLAEPPVLEPPTDSPSTDPTSPPELWTEEAQDPLGGSEILGEGLISEDDPFALADEESAVLGGGDTTPFTIKPEPTPDGAPPGEEDDLLFAEPILEEETEAPLAADEEVLDLTDVEEDSTAPPSHSGAVASPPEISEELLSPPEISEELLSPPVISEEPPSPAQISKEPLSPSPISEELPSPPNASSIQEPCIRGAQQAPLPHLDSQAVRDVLEKVAWEAFGPLSEQLVREVVQKVEAIAWEVIPQLAERLIREELERMKAHTPE